MPVEQTVITIESLYAREIDPEGTDSLSRIARRIQPGLTVLDLGAGPGALGRYLGAAGCILDGVDSDAQTAGRAVPYYRDFRVADLTTASIATLFPGRSYDIIVCADLLEHLPDPAFVLDQLPEILKAGGRLLLSVPNVAYAGLIAELLQGEFRYRPTGLLDQTHLRFFTRASLERFLAAHQFFPLAVEVVLQHPAHSEFHSSFQIFPPSLQKQILAAPDALAYQFIIEAIYGEVPVPSPPLTKRLRPVWPYICQLYWRSGEDDFAEINSILTTGAISPERQTVRLNLPAVHDLSGLRLDLADRPGLAYIHDLRLLDTAGALIWSADTTGDLQWTGERLLVSPVDDKTLAVLLAGTDPILSLPVPREKLLLLLNGGVFELEISWPQSSLFADYAAMLERLEVEHRLRYKQLSTEHQHLIGLLRTHERTLVDRQEEIRRQEGALRQACQVLALLQAELADREEQLLEGEMEKADFISRITDRESRLRERDTERVDLIRRLGESERLAAAMQVSTSWRCTAVLRWVKSKYLSLLGWCERNWRWRLHQFVLAPGHEVEQRGNGFISLGNDPQLQLNSCRLPLPTGWCEISMRCPELPRPVLYVDSGQGFLEENSIPLLGAGRSNGRRFICLPEQVRALRLDPLTGPGPFAMEDVRIRELGRWPAALLMLLAEGQEQRLDWPWLQRKMRNAWSIFRLSGAAGIKRRLQEKALVRNDPAGHDYRHWLATYDSLGPEEVTLIRRHIATMASPPLISILMPTFNTPEAWLRQAIHSVCCQLYPHWELCIADDASTMAHVKRIIEEFRASEPRIKVVYRPVNGHISAASNSALEMATGAFVALLDHDDELAEHALYRVAAELLEHPEADLLYSDEDKIDEHGQRFSPYFKSDWNIDLFYSHNLITHLGVYRSSRVREIGGFRQGFEGAQDYDLALRMIEGSDPDRIRHIPAVLYHWRAIAGSTALNPQQKDYAELAARRAIQAHFDRTGSPARIEAGPSAGLHRARYPLSDDSPLISIIIPTRDGHQLLAKCLEGLQQGTDYPKLQIIIADNRTTCRTTKRLFQQAAARGCRILPCDVDFNFSQINNLAVAASAGELVCFLNNDIEVIDPAWLSEMASHALRPEIGAVGAKLYYPDWRLQHAGVILGLGADRIAGVPHHGSERGDLGYNGKAVLLQNFSAVTAACMVMRRDVFDQVGGFDENLKVAFNDVDLCLRVVRAGYRVLWTPYAELFHHESASRGYEDTPQKRARFLREAEYMRQKWGLQLLTDPFYNPNLSLDRPDFALAFPPRSSPPWRNALGDDRPVVGPTGAGDAAL